MPFELYFKVSAQSTFFHLKELEPPDIRQKNKSKKILDILFDFHKIKNIYIKNCTKNVFILKFIEFNIFYSKIFITYFHFLFSKLFMIQIKSSIIIRVMISTLSSSLSTLFPQTKSTCEPQPPNLNVSFSHSFSLFQLKKKK